MDPVIEFRNVTYQYPLTETPAVKNIDLSLEPGKLYGIIGPNGAGKTTLAVMMCGFIPSFYKGTLSGELRIKGKNILEYKKGEISRISGYVFQNPFTQISGVKDTVFEEIGFALENFGADPAEMEERILSIAEQTGITELLEKSPYELSGGQQLGQMGLSERANHYPHQLSGGQQQRVALASLLVLQPEIMVIDEPTSQLDPEGTESVFRIIAALKQSGSTIILIEHKIDLVAEYADEIIVVSEGGILCQGTPKAVFSDPELPKHHVRLPYVTQIAHELMARGVRLDTVPVTESEAVEVFEKALEGGNGNG